MIRFINPIKIIAHYWQYRNLIWQLTIREVSMRYKGSFLGIAWSFIQPLFMLMVYTFVFSVIFEVKWGVTSNEGRAAFALALFMGLITYNIFSEVANSSTSIIMENVNYVKKVVFPLEILPLVRTFSVLVNAAISLTVLIAGIICVTHFLHWTIVLLPIVWLPVLFFTIGCAYFFASISVFIRDLNSTVGILTTVLLFLSPIFYPSRSVPESFQFIIHLNPLAVFVEEARQVVLWGVLPDWIIFCEMLLLSFGLWVLGFIWFMKIKKAFADVI